MKLNIKPYDGSRIQSPGIFRDMPNEVYHLPGTGLSRSTAAEMVFKSPDHAKYHIDHPEEQTIFMAMGSLVHCATLEPGKLRGSYVVKPAENEEGDKWDGRKTWCKQWLADHQGQICLTAEQDEQVRGCTAALKENKTMYGMLLVGHPELSVFVQYEGLTLKCRPDLLAEDKDGKIWCLDIKKCQDAGYHAFRRECQTQHRDFQEAWYRFVLGLAGVGVDHFVFAAVEEKPPHGVALYRIDEQNITAMAPQIQRSIDLWHQCTETGVWPGYASEIMTVTWGMRFPI